MPTDKKAQNNRWFAYQQVHCITKDGKREEKFKKIFIKILNKKNIEKTGVFKKILID